MKDLAGSEEKQARKRLNSGEVVHSSESLAISEVFSLQCVSAFPLLALLSRRSLSVSCDLYNVIPSVLPSSCSAVFFPLAFTVSLLFHFSRAFCSGAVRGSSFFFISAFFCHYPSQNRCIFETPHFLYPYPALSVVGY